MLKKIILGCALAGAAASASAMNLTLFKGDFITLMNSVAQDIAPSMRLGALSGDLQADSTIEHFDLTILSWGFNLTDGIGTALRPGATPWTFPIHMDKFIPSNVPTWYETFAAYPSYKFAFGVGLGGGWDATLSGNYMPSALSALALKPLSGSKSAPELAYSNVGLAVRKSIIKDTDSTPGLSLGAGYHFASFNVSGKVDDWIPKVDLSNNGTDVLTTTGTLGFAGSANVLTADLQLSKRLGIFTPFAKVTGAYQNTTVTGDANLTAAAPISGTVNIDTHPSVNLSDFAFLTTVGFDLNLFVFHYNLNVMADTSRARFNIHSFSLDGIDANAVLINTGLHWSF